MKILLYIGFGIVSASFLYLIVKAIRESIERERFRKVNREAQFSGSPLKEKKGFFSSLYTFFFDTPESIGERGERRVSSFLEDLPCWDYKVFNDLLLTDGQYTTQIDHLVLSRFGVFVIETKNVHGKIYGSEQAEYWKQYLPDWGYKRYGYTQEHKMRNPIWQNEGHIKSLRRLVFGNDVPIEGIVVFPDGTDLRGTVDHPVLRMGDVVLFIKSFRNEVLNTEQIESYRQRLLSIISTSQLDRQRHIDNVYRNQIRRDSAVTNGKCPLCGGMLMLRKGRYGQFYGCSNYPECKYTHPC